MIFSLRGIVTFLSDQILVIELCGIGYGVKIGKNHAANLEIGGEISVSIFHHQTDQGVSLFGFPDFDRRNVFELLLEVSGIGPRIALGIVDSATPGKILEAVIASDASFFSAFQGVGAKLAKKIILDLENKAERFPLSRESRPVSGTAQTGSGAANLNDLASALRNLGYAKFDAIRTANEIFNPEIDLGENLKNCLKALKKPDGKKL